MHLIIPDPADLRSFGTLLLISRPIRRRSSLGRRPRAHISQGCARCKESGPDRLGHSLASGPVAPGRTRVGARPPSCGAAVDAPPPPAHGSFERRGARALGGGEGRCVFSGARRAHPPPPAGLCAGRRAESHEIDDLTIAAIVLHSTPRKVLRLADYGCRTGTIRAAMTCRKTLPDSFSPYAPKV